MSARTAREWSGVDVTISAVDAELAHLRRETVGDDGQPHQRTSVMTHIAWVPPELGRGGRADAGGARRAASLADGHPRADARTSPTGSTRGSRSGRSRSAIARSRSEVIELTLRGERSLAPASVVLPLAISDLPVFLRWRGEPLLR